MASDALSFPRDLGTSHVAFAALPRRGLPRATLAAREAELQGLSQGTALDAAVRQLWLSLPQVSRDLPWGRR